VHADICSVHLKSTSHLWIYSHPMKVPQDVAVLKCMPHLRMHTLVKLHLFAKYTPPTVQTITSEGVFSTLRKQPSIYGFTTGGKCCKRYCTIADAAFPMSCYILLQIMLLGISVLKMLSLYICLHNRVSPLLVEGSSQGLKGPGKAWPGHSRRETQLPGSLSK